MRSGAPGDHQGVSVTRTVERTTPAYRRPGDGPPQLQASDKAGWLQRYAQALLLVDALALGLAALLSLYVRFGARPGELRGVSYYAVAAAMAITWLGVLALSRCYEARFLAAGPEEFKRVTNASIRLIAVIALIGYATGLELARGFVAVFLPAGLLGLLLGRYLARLVLYRRRRRGEWSHRVLVLGSEPHVGDLAAQLRREPLAGFQVVGACVPGGLSEISGGVPVVGTLGGVSAALAAVQADTVAVAACPAITGEGLRRLSYELEGTGVDLLVAPALTNVTGSRINIRPVAGLPLLHLDEPELTGARKAAKAVFDRSVATVSLVLLAPVLTTVAIAVRVTSPGPAIFRQQRVGRDGELFCVWKFRSMRQDAEQLRHTIEQLNEHEGVLFKVRQDPRITPIGRFLRKYSLDELPQLVNVARGQMSLVGPRPPLESEVARYEGHARRRLLVKPGMTGLWQISGRSDLSWDETVRLDLQYVENWSLGLDLMILAKTGLAVVKGSGAY
jgi:exopolysaccharide biosynthesis polyprenyl glycosylphosphotransferase